MSKLYSTMIENFLVPVYDIARGTSRYRCQRILEKTQYLSQNEMDRLQRMNLRALVAHAYKTVPYYHRMFKERKLKPDDIKTHRDLIKLPVLRKFDIRKNFDDLISRAYPINQLIPYETGGTGSPLKFYITRENRSWEIAAEYRAYAWANYHLGDRCFMLWGSHRDLHTNIVKKTAGFLQRVDAVDPFNLSDETLRKFSVLLRKFNPEVIRGYATPVFMIAKYIVKAGIYDITPKAVITGAEMLFDHMRKTIERAFACPVFNYYGTREIGAIASECEAHDGFHVSAENVVTEFVKEDEPVEEGDNGLILLTSLRNFGMPLIRYQIGDVGEPTDEVCSCGRGLPLMKSIKGRESHFLAVSDEKSGKVIPLEASVMMDHFMTLLHSPPENYRVIQESLNHMTIRIVRSNSFSSQDTELLRELLREQMGTKVEIEIQFVDNLPPLPSGKRSQFISKINAFEANAKEKS